MSLRSGRLLSTLFLVEIPLFITFRNAPSAFAGEPQWMEIRSPHFSVVADAGEKRGREVAMWFEQQIADRNHVVLIGADQFSCSWTSQKVAVNYREGETGKATMISLEIQ
jgi:hypothetical protein